MRAASAEVFAARRFSCAGSMMQCGAKSDCIGFYKLVAGQFVS